MNVVQNISTQKTSKRKILGFTLIELLIALVVIGIIAAISYPSYQKFIRKSRRTEGRALIHETLEKILKFEAQNPSATDITFVPTQTANYSGVINKCTGDCTQLIAYKIGDTDANGVRCVSVIALVRGPQVGDTECRCFYADSVGRRLPDVCWQ